MEKGHSISLETITPCETHNITVLVKKYTTLVGETEEKCCSIM